MLKTKIPSNCQTHTERYQGWLNLTVGLNGLSVVLLGGGIGVGVGAGGAAASAGVVSGIPKEREEKQKINSNNNVKQTKIPASATRR